MNDLEFLDDIDFDNIEEVEKRTTQYTTPCAVFYLNTIGARLLIPTCTAKLCSELSDHVKIAKSGKYLLILNSKKDSDYKATRKNGEILICLMSAKNSGMIPGWVFKKRALPIYKCKNGLAIPMPTDGPEG